MKNRLIGNIRIVEYFRNNMKRKGGAQGTGTACFSVSENARNVEKIH